MTLFDKLYTSREKLVKTVLDLVEKVNNLETNSAISIMEKDDNDGLYVKGIGGFDGTNLGESGIKTLQTVIEDLE